MKISLTAILIVIALIIAGLYATGNLYTILDIDEPMPDEVIDALLFRPHDSEAINHYGLVFRTCAGYGVTHPSYTSGACPSVTGYSTEVHKWVESGLTENSDGDIIKTQGTYSHFYLPDKTCTIDGALVDGCSLSRTVNNAMGEYNLVVSHRDDPPSETLVEDCMDTGVTISPNTIKCAAYARPNVGISIGKEGWKVSPDGMSISHVVCDYASYDGLCDYDPDYLLHVSDKHFIGDFWSGDDFSVDVLTYVDGAPVPGLAVNGELRKDNVAFAYTTGMTGADGYVTLDFINPRALGDVYFYASTVYRLETHTSLGNYMFFNSRPITAIPSTTSYEQFSDKQIEYTVTIKDENGIAIPSYKLTNMKDISTITNENVNNIEIIPRGDGVYGIHNAVTGPGRFTGMIEFTYNTVTFQSSPIIIEVLEPGIAYSITGFGSPPTMWEENLIEMHFTSTSYIDEAVDPETIRVTIIYPDGSTTEVLTKEDLNRTAPGHFTFEYVYTQPQLYTFLIKPTQLGYETLEHEKLVTVSEAISPYPTPSPTPSPTPGPNWGEMIFEFLLEHKTIGFTLFSIIGIILLSARYIKRKRLL